MKDTKSKKASIDVITGCQGVLAAFLLRELKDYENMRVEDQAEIVKGAAREVISILLFGEEPDKISAYQEFFKDDLLKRRPRSRVQNGASGSL